MKFVTGTETDAILAIAKRIQAELKTSKRVLWLTSGGSNTRLQVEIMSYLRIHSDNAVSSLTILPIDERYGSFGHKDSNSEALRVAGFDPGTANWIDVLAKNLSFSETVHLYSDIASTELANAQVIIGQFGMGDDGHVAGIKPHSPAVKDDSATVIGFEWSDYIRMTMSINALLQIQVGFMPVFGEKKHDVLLRMQRNAEPTIELPAHLLYDIPEFYVYNDQLESEA